MPGVVALLGEPHKSMVEALWEGMHREFGVPIGYPGAVPHISLHIGEHDVAAGAEQVVQTVARASAPLTVYSAGLGVFTGPVPVVHLTVARSPELAALALRLDVAMAAAGFPSTDPHFVPGRWMPHITIAHRNLAGIELGPLLGWLVAQSLAWEIPLHSLSIARETELAADILSTFLFAAE